MRDLWLFLVGLAVVLGLPFIEATGVLPVHTAAVVLAYLSASAGCLTLAFLLARRP